MSGSNGVVGKALRLCVPATQFSPSDRAVVLAAAAECLGRGTLTPGQQRAVDQLKGGNVRPDDRPHLIELADELTGGARRVVQQALLLSIYVPARSSPPVAPELLQRIATKAAIVEAMRLAADAALDALVLAQRERSRAKGPDERAARTAALPGAREAYRVAHEAHQQAQGALTDLYVERDARSRDALLAESTK